MHDRYQVVTEPPLSPPGIPLETLKELATALNNVDSPVAEALGEVIPEMVELAFNSITSKNRQLLLRELGIRMAAPRRAGRSLSQDILSRLRRHHRERKCHCPVQTLTEQVMNDVATATVVSAAGKDTFADPIARWGSALVRLAIFSWCSASAADARVLVWASHHNWLGSRLETEQLAAVAEAAAKVLSTTGDSAVDDEEGAEPKLEVAAASAVLRESGPAFLSDNVGVSEVEPLHESPHDSLENVCQTLSAAVTAARESARRIGEAVEDGRPPSEDDVRTVSDLIRAFSRARESFASAGVADVPPRLADLLRAAENHQAALAGDQAARRILGDLLAITCRDGSPAAAALAEASALTRQLLDKPTWDATDRDQAAALGDLVAIAVLRDRADAAPQILVLQQRVAQALPNCALAAVMFTDLLVPRQPTEDPTEVALTPDRSAPGATASAQQARTLLVGAPTEPVEVRTGENATTLPTAEPSHSAQVPERPSISGLPAPTTQPHPREETPEVPRSGTAVEGALARLVSERRFGLAYRLAQASDRPSPEVTALHLAACADALRTGSGNDARAMRQAIQRLDAHVLREADVPELVVVPALIRAALMTGEHVAGAQLKAVAPRLPEALSALATAVADRALNGALMIAPPVAVIADVSGSEARLRDVTEQCRSLLKPQRLRYNRATDIAKRWLEQDDVLGRALHAIASGSPEAESAARELVDRLSRRAEVHAEIERMDRKRRGPTAKPLHGSAFQDLVHLVERVVDCAKAWLDAADTVRNRTSTDADWAIQEISAMRHNLLDLRVRALAELDGYVSRSATLSSAAAQAAHASLSDLFSDLADGALAQRSATEVDIDQVVDAELLKVAVRPGAQPSVQEILGAVDRDWREALELQTKHDAFGSAYAILDLAEHGALPAGGHLSFEPGTRASIEAEEARRRVELRTRHDDMAAELRRAQAEGAVSDDQDLRLQELLADAQPETEDGRPRDLSVVRVALDEVEALLPRYRQEAADRLRARLEALPNVSEDERTQVLRHLDTGGLATAADLVYFLEIGEPVPEIEAGESHLTEFFPAIPDGLSSGITKDVVELVRTRSAHSTLPALDYGDLSAGEAARAADALSDWQELGALDPRERSNINARLKLLPALSLLGYNAKGARPLDELPRSREYRFFEVTGIDITGRAWAPAFGSKIQEQGDRLRVLVLWGQPPAQLVLSLAANEPSGESLLVVYFGTFSREARAELAAGAAGQPLIVVDDAVLAYLTARGNRQISAATETLLPFSGVNPYIREKRGRIGREMFYGRDAERKSILDPDGTQIIFGGRGLGKSALLNEAGSRFQDQKPGYHHPVYMNLDHHNIGEGASLGPETIWSVLNQELTNADVLPAPQGRKAREIDPYERVRAGLKAWLEGDTRRRLLVLMDECDRFFEADAPHFTETRRLKGLGQETNGRAKVVFAGLHSVQRFTKLARNGPFSHLAQTPTVIGPLAPQFAADLLVEPMRALGFEFEDVDLVNRVLGYCSYQPFLLQMFGSRLVEVMHRRRARRDLVGPPYVIQDTDVETVEADPRLRADITAAFKDTLNLDDRYNVIANVLAHHARENGLETRLSDVELRDECSSWWKEGFAQLDTEGFRAYLSEMVGLGILAPNHDGRGWHLRGPNALRMIGTSQEVEAQLLSASTECVLEETLALQVRPELPDKRSAPLTVTQIDDLLGDHVNQTRIVLGTVATGVGDVADTLRAVTDRVAGWTLPPIGRQSIYRQELTAGRPGERRVIVSDFANHTVGLDACLEAVELAEQYLPTRPGVTRAVVLVVGIDHLTLWRTALAGEGSAGAVVLRRHDQRSLKAWAQRSELFETEERLARLFKATGGWPLLVHRAIELHTEVGNQDESLRRLESELEEKGRARDFLTATGLLANPEIAAGYQAVSDQFDGEDAGVDDIVAAIELSGVEQSEARWIFSCLEALQVYEQVGDRYRLEPVLANAWARGA